MLVSEVWKILTGANRQEKGGGGGGCTGEGVPVGNSHGFRVQPCGHSESLPFTSQSYPLIGQKNHGTRAYRGPRDEVLEEPSSRLRTNPPTKQGTRNHTRPESNYAPLPRNFRCAPRDERAPSFRGALGPRPVSADPAARSCTGADISTDRPSDLSTPVGSEHHFYSAAEGASRWCSKVPSAGTTALPLPSIGGHAPQLLGITANDTPTTTGGHLSQSRAQRAGMPHENSSVTPGRGAPTTGSTRTPNELGRF